MDTLLGIPSRGWIAISIWLLVLILPWSYVLYFLRWIDRSGVERWGAKPAADGGRRDAQGEGESTGSAGQ